MAAVVADTQLNSESSVPVHCRSSKWMGPVPMVNVLSAPVIAVLSGMKEYNDITGQTLVASTYGLHYTYQILEP